MGNIFRIVGFIASLVSLIAGNLANSEERKERDKREDEYLDRKVQEHFDKYVNRGDRG